ncbi:MAG: thioredoxin family protein [Chitinophagales bacterium]|nr:thioredoxin family protein [Chitinophagales bacterium]
MKYLLLIFALIASTQLTAQEKYKKFTDKDTKQLIYQGQVTFNDLATEPDFVWYKAGIKGYQPNKDVVSELAAALKQYNIKPVVFMGTWCDDTHILLPKFYNVLQACNYPASKVTMYALDMEKKGKDGEELKYHVTRVPTFILLDGQKEIGRITETVDESMETDMLRIILDYVANDMEEPEE